MMQLGKPDEIIQKLALSKQLTPKWFVQSSKDEKPYEAIFKNCPCYDDCELCIPIIEKAGYKIIGATDRMKFRSDNESISLFSLIYMHKENKDERFVLHLIPAESEFALELDKLEGEVIEGIKILPIDDFLIAIFNCNKIKFILVSFNSDTDKALKIVSNVKQPDKILTPSK